MYQVGGARSSRVWFRKKNIYFFNIFILLMFVGIGIVRTTMSVSTLYLFPFSSHMQKTKRCFQSERRFVHKNQNYFCVILCVIVSAACSLHIVCNFYELWCTSVSLGWLGVSRSSFQIHKGSSFTPHFVGASFSQYPSDYLNWILCNLYSLHLYLVRCKKFGNTKDSWPRKIIPNKLSITLNCIIYNFGFISCTLCILLCFNEKR